MIYILGLGAGDESQLTNKIMATLTKYPLYLRTDQHPMINYLKDNNIAYTSFDSIYEENDQFIDVYEKIISTISKLGEENDIIYGVPGHPCIAEYTVKELMKTNNAKIIGGQGFLDDMFASLNIDPIDGLLILDSINLDIKQLNPHLNLIVAQVFDQLVASNLKLDLMEVYDDEHLICVVSEAGSKNEVLSWKALYQLDHNFVLNNLCSVFVPAIKKD